MSLNTDLEVFPVTPDHWQDLETLFGKNGAYGGCWCMWWRVTRSQFGKQAGQGNKETLKAIVDSGEVPGIIAYAGGQTIAWCSVAPREAFPSLERSRTLRRVDDQPVWSIVCFYRELGLKAPVIHPGDEKPLARMGWLGRARWVKTQAGRARRRSRAFACSPFPLFAETERIDSQYLEVRRFGAKRIAS